MGKTNTHISKIIFLDHICVNKIKDPFEMNEHSYNNENFFNVIKRTEGISDTFLKTSLHWHDFYEMEFICGGSGTHFLSEYSFGLSRGCVILRTPKDLHTTIENPTDVLNLYNIKFTDKYLPPELIGTLLDKKAPLVVFFNEEEFQYIISEIELIRREIAKGGDFSLQMLVSSFTRICILFLRKYSINRDRTATGDATNMQIIISYMMNNFQTNINLTDLAKMVHLTPNYLSELFIKTIGKTFSEYLMGLRMSCAQQLLSNSTLTVNEIAYACGFNTSSYFIRAFKKYCNIQPIQYRRAHKPD